MSHDDVVVCVIGAFDPLVDGHHVLDDPRQLQVAADLKGDPFERFDGGLSRCSIFGRSAADLIPEPLNLEEEIAAVNAVEVADGDGGEVQ